MNSIHLILITYFVSIISIKTKSQSLRSYLWTFRIPKTMKWKWIECTQSWGIGLLKCSHSPNVERAQQYKRFKELKIKYKMDKSWDKKNDSTDRSSGFGRQHIGANGWHSRNLWRSRGEQTPHINGFAAAYFWPFNASTSFMSSNNGHKIVSVRDLALSINECASKTSTLTIIQRMFCTQCGIWNN